MANDNCDQLSSFYTILLTNKQTNSCPWKHNLLGAGLTQCSCAGQMQRLHFEFCAEPRTASQAAVQAGWARPYSRPSHTVNNLAVAFNVWFLCIFLLHFFLLHCALSLVAQCIVIGPVCVFVTGGQHVFVCGCLSVCYHDNSKLRASIFTKLGL